MLATLPVGYTFPQPTPRVRATETWTSTSTSANHLERHTHHTPSPCCSTIQPILMEIPSGSALRNRPASMSIGSSCNRSTTTSTRQIGSRQSSGSIQPNSFHPLHTTPTLPGSVSRRRSCCNTYCSAKPHHSKPLCPAPPHTGRWYPGRYGQPPNLEEIFHYFCAFGDKENAGCMTAAKLTKLSRELRLLDENLTVTDVDLIFLKARPQGARGLGYAAFCDVLTMMATCKYPEYPPETALALFLQVLSTWV
mmetsp:Transcript_100103/g.172791  ORF Transcript_100103/g.172791 Transcript_100103/m.172791 type:complete len:251 (-) Transcript_100103:172-924(-)